MSTISLEHTLAEATQKPWKASHALQGWVEGSPFGGGATIGSLDVLGRPGATGTCARRHTRGSSAEEFSPGGIPLLKGAGPLILIQVTDVRCAADSPAGSRAASCLRLPRAVSMHISSQCLIAICTYRWYHVGLPTRYIIIVKLPSPALHYAKAEC